MDTQETVDLQAAAKEAITGGLPFSTPDEWQSVIENFTKNGRTMQDLTAVTPESMEILYMVGFQKYQSAQYADAEKIFQLLAMLNHFERKYWKALGASRAMQGSHEKALAAFGYMGFLDFTDPFPAVHSAKSFIALNKIPEAMSALRAAIYNSEGKPNHEQLHAEANAMLATLEKATAKAGQESQS